MNILIFSDMHTYKPYKVQSILNDYSKKDLDIIFILGDMATGYFYDIKDYFYYKNIPILCVLGNHDNYEVFNNFEYLINLHSKLYTKNSINILGIEGGLGMTCANTTNILHTHKDIVNIFENLKEKPDIMISHNSPYGINHSSYNNVHEGFIGIRKYLDNNKNTIVLHGHQHKNIITKYNDNIIIGIYGIVYLEIKEKNIYNYNIIMED